MASTTTNITASLLILALSAVSCVKDGGGRNLSPGKIFTAVADKNYENASEVGVEPMDESLPIASYLNSLLARIRPRGSNDYMAYEEAMAPGEIVHPLNTSQFTNGSNEIVLIGNETIQNAGAANITLHPGGSEYTDLYIGHASLTFPASGERTIPMYRAKGKLIVDISGMTAGTTVTGISVSGVYATVSTDLAQTGGTPDSPAFVYRGSVAVSKIFTPPTSGTQPRPEIMLAPSVSPTPSRISITLSSAGVRVDIPAFDATIRRNRIILVRPEFNIPTGSWSVSTMVDGEWENVEYMDISR